MTLTQAYPSSRKYADINDPYYRGPLRDKGDHHRYNYTTWDQAWSRTVEDSNPSRAPLIP